MRNFELTGYYGSGKTPCTIFTLELSNGNTWYAVEGSVNVNCTDHEVHDGINVEDISDIDSFTAAAPINSKEDLEEAVLS